MTPPFRSPKAPSTRQELALVLGVPLCFIGALQFLIYQPDTARTFSDLRILRVLLFEVAFGLPALFLLTSKGWTWSSISLPWAPRDLLRGLGVLLMAYLITTLGWLLAYNGSPELVESVAATPFTSTSSVAAVLALAVVNPLFEECLWLGYILNGPGESYPRASLLLSVAARTFAHSYQGWPAIFAILPLGLWFTRYYWRTGRLWPVIIAHAAIDMIGLFTAAFRTVSNRGHS